MNELQVILHNSVEVVDSRDVARMVEREHNALLKTIRSYCDYLGEGEIAQSDFFIPSTYTSAQNKEQPCYLLTKKGCDMVANKMTGEKGVLFTAAYVTAFEKMRERLQDTSASQKIKEIDASKAALAEAKLNNSRARLASAWMKVAQTAPPEFQQVCAHYASAALAGKPVLPLPAVEEPTYSAAEVGEMLGGISANKVGRLANEHNLKTPDYGVQVWDKSPHSSKQVQSWRYNSSAVDRLREITGGNHS